MVLQSLCLLSALTLVLHPSKLRLLLLLKTFLDSLTEIFRKLFVATSADRLCVPCSKITFLQELLASIAKEVLLVIGLVEELLTTSSDRLLTEGAVVSEKLNVVSLTVRKTVVLEVMRLDESLVTNMAREVIGMPNLTEGSNRATLTRLTALGALLQEQNLVVRGTVVVAFELVAIASLEFNTALLTTVVTRVHELALNEQVWANDRSIAHSALMGLGTDDTNFFLHTVGAVDVLGLRLDFIALTDKVGTTADANEVLRVEGKTTLSVNDLSADNVVTYLTTLRMKLHEVLLAVELVIRANKEATARERLRAVLTDEVIRVIVLAEGLRNLTDNGLVANSAVWSNWDIITHNLRLLLLHKEVRIIVTSRSR
jgi:hypothetical protein